MSVLDAEGWSTINRKKGRNSQVNSRGESFSSTVALADGPVDPSTIKPAQDNNSSRKRSRKRKEKINISGKSYSDALTTLSKVTINRPPVVKSKTNKDKSKIFDYTLDSVSRYSPLN